MRASRPTNSSISTGKPKKSRQHDVAQARRRGRVGPQAGRRSAAWRNPARRRGPAATARPSPNSASDISGEAVAPGAVETHRRLRLRPGAIEERQHPVMEDVEKAREGRVARVARALAHVFGQMGRQRPVGPQQAEEIHRRGAAACRPCPVRTRRAWSDKRSVPAPARSARSRRARAATRPPAGAPDTRIRAGAPPGRSRSGAAASSSLPQGAQSVRHRPVRRGQRTSSPRASVFTTVSVNELIDTYWRRTARAPRPARTRRRLRTRRRRA